MIWILVAFLDSTFAGENYQYLISSGGIDRSNTLNSLAYKLIFIAVSLLVATSIYGCILMDTLAISPPKQRIKQ